MGIITGFENSWGPWMVLDADQPGLADLLHLRRFMTEIVPFARLRPAPELLGKSDAPLGHRPAALATAERDIVMAYLPVGGSIQLAMPSRAYRVRWFDPRTGEWQDATSRSDAAFASPQAGADAQRPEDWVLLVTAA
jgi:hypothetical protein